MPGPPQIIVGLFCLRRVLRGPLGIYFCQQIQKTPALTIFICMSVGTTVVSFSLDRALTGSVGGPIL